jgi:hypothetical protein
MTDLLNAMGKQSIANLQMSIQKRAAATEETSDHDGDDLEGVYLDLDFSPSNQLESGRRQNGYHQPRIFSQVIASRGSMSEATTEATNPGDTDAFGRRNPNKPTSQRYIHLITLSRAVLLTFV